MFVVAYLSQCVKRNAAVYFGNINCRVGNAAAHTAGNRKNIRKHTLFGVIVHGLYVIGQYIPGKGNALALTGHKVIDRNAEYLRNFGKLGYLRVA